MDNKKLTLEEVLKLTDNGELNPEDITEISKLLKCSSYEVLQDLYFGNIKIFDGVSQAFDYLFDVSEVEDMVLLVDVIKATGELHCKNLEKEMIDRAHDLIYYKDKIIFIYGY